MDMINMTAIGLVVAYGLIWQEHLSQFSLVPSDLRENSPNVWTAATVVAQLILRLTKFDGIQFGTRVMPTKPIKSCVSGRLVTWSIHSSKNYQIYEVSPINAINLDTGTRWDQRSYLLYFWYSDHTIDDSKKANPITSSDGTLLDIDISSIPWIESPWKS